MNTPDSEARTRLSFMWTFVLMNMIYADILSAMNADILKQFLAGHAEQITITPGFLLLAAVVTEIPIAMVALSQLLPMRITRWANIGAAIFTILYIWAGGVLSMPHYIFCASAQTIALVYITWYAWKLRPVTAPAGAPKLVAE